MLPNFKISFKVTLINDTNVDTNRDKWANERELIVQK